MVLTHIARDHFANLPALEQKTKAGAGDAGVVADGCEVVDVWVLVEGVDEGVGDAAEAETAGEEGGVGFHVGEGGGGGGEDFVDFEAGGGSAEVARGGDGELEVGGGVSLVFVQRRGVGWRLPCLGVRAVAGGISREWPWPRICSYKLLLVPVVYERALSVEWVRAAVRVNEGGHQYSDLEIR